MKKFLMVATVPSMIGQFNVNNIEILLSMGYEVHVACNFEDRTVWTDEKVEKFEKQLSKMKVKKIQINFARTPFNLLKLIKSYIKLHRILDEHKYAGLHCHTPVAGMIARFAALGNKAKVIYTAHGFHFYKGAPLKNWFLYYPVEKICSYMTDTLITINKEDYLLAKKKMKARKVVYVPGVGVDVKKFSGKNVSHIRDELNIPADAKLLLSVGELNRNKNHESVIKALAEIHDVQQKKVFYIVVGQGELKDKLQNLINVLRLEKQVFLLGFRQDIAEIYSSADIFIFPSYREGLSVALMEAMASQLPVACSSIRGNNDLIEEKGGVLFDPGDVRNIKQQIEKLITKCSSQLYKMGVYNLQKIQHFDNITAEKAVVDIYGQPGNCGCEHLLHMFMRNNLRNELGCSSDECMLLSVGELSERKNHAIVINALSKLKLPYKYYIVGKGDLQNKIQKQINQLELDDSVKMLGFQLNVKELLSASDIFIFPSLHEGLPVALMEAMASQKMCLVSKIRGNIDLIEDERCLFEANNAEEIKEKLSNMINLHWEQQVEIKKCNLEKIRCLDISLVRNMMREIYLEI